MHRRLQSITTWLGSPRQSTYSFVPLSSTSQPGSPDILGGNTFPAASRPRRLNVPPFILIWTWVSPPLVLALLVTLLLSQPKDDGILNPYACHEKPLHHSLAKMCEADPKKPDWRMQVRRDAFRKL